MQNIFNSDEEFRLGMLTLAVSTCLCPDVEMIAFELMNNHLHLILSGSKDACMTLFSSYSQRIRMIYTRAKKVLDWRAFKAELIPIETLEALRNEIIYTHRNAYIANGNFNPFSYPWGSGHAYFNFRHSSLPIISFDSLTYQERRKITHCRDISPFGKLKFSDGSVYVPSFCNITLGESFFVDSRSYFNSLTRKAEAFSLIAERLKEKVFLTDDEMYHVTVKYVRDKFDTQNLSLLTPDQRLTTAKELRYRYNANLQQIRRLLKLDTAILNKLFQ
jgi:REP element-mobilizing transposase RayT